MMSVHTQPPRQASQPADRPLHWPALWRAAILGTTLALTPLTALAQPQPTPGIQSAPLQPRANPSRKTLFAALPPSETGVTFENRFAWDDDRKHLYQHGYAGGGVCIGDFDNDGRPDIYLVSQVGPDKLFRQTADFAFEDVTESAGIAAPPAWGTGATFADIDGDNDLDLYVCNLDAPNWLFINQGDGTFIESAAEKGLDFSGASVMAAFADFDQDGHLDLYLLTNRLYPDPLEDSPQLMRVAGKTVLAPGMDELFAMQNRPIDGEIQKFVVKAGQPDRLYRNNGDATFTDVSEQAGISGNHPGLAVTWWDSNQDGLPDLYISNDFWDADRLYENNGDGTFTDVLADRLPHTPWFSMGADFGDINNDGLMDFMAADMSPTTHYMGKIMMGDMNDSRWFLETAEPRQFMRNALYLNTGTDRFMEIANLAHTASTDWTWSLKFGDLDNDGLLDLFATNGTANHSFDPDLTRKLREVEDRFVQSSRNDPAALLAEQWDLYRQHPPRREKNIALRNLGDLEFAKAGTAWGLDHNSISFGAALADLDRDGDLDLVVSNIDDPVSILRNQGTKGHAVLIRLRGAAANTYGLGATVTIETETAQHTRYLSLTRGYMSANEPLIHFGLGAASTILSLTVDWPGGPQQRFTDLAADRFYTITQAPDSSPRIITPVSDQQAPMFAEVADQLGLGANSGPETNFEDFDRQPLLPAKLSQLGPGIAWGDADADGDDDVFIGAPAGLAGQLFLRGDDGRFTLAPGGPWESDSAHEDMAPLFFDIDADGDQDLYIASGGVECDPGDPVLRDRLYLNDGQGRFTTAPPTALPSNADSSSAVVAADFDQDGDLDLFVGSRVIPGYYPLTPQSHLLRNDRGVFTDVTNQLAPGLAQVGLVTSALWTDADGDGLIDLLVACEWGPVSLWRNTGGQLQNQTQHTGLADTLGWWNSITGADLDADGDTDYIVMNAGLNTKYKSSPDKPAYLYYGSFEDGGPRHLVEAKPSAEKMLPVRGLSCSSGAMPFIRDKMPTYHDFAIASLPEIYSEARLDAAIQLRATTLQSGVLFNQGVVDGFVRFEFVPLPRLAQAAPGQGVVATDIDADGFTDVYCVQNSFAREPETGNWDGGISLLFRGDGTGTLTPVPPARSGLVMHGDAKALTVTDINGDDRPDFFASRNDDRQAAFARPNTDATAPRHLAIRLQGLAPNPTAIGARVTLHRADGNTQTFELYAGSGYLSQSSPVLFFGMGDSADAAEALVRWPDGQTSRHAIGAGATSAVLNHPKWTDGNN